MLTEMLEDKVWICRRIQRGYLGRLQDGATKDEESAGQFKDQPQQGSPLANDYKSCRLGTGTKRKFLKQVSILIQPRPNNSALDAGMKSPLVYTRLTQRHGHCPCKLTSILVMHDHTMSGLRLCQTR